MKSNLQRLSAWAVGLVLALASLPALGQDEKHYRHVDGHRIGLWPDGDDGFTADLEIGRDFFHAVLPPPAAGAPAGGERRVVWKWNDEAGSEKIAGEGTIRVSDEMVVLSIDRPVGHFKAFHRRFPSGVYKRLSEEERLVLARGDYTSADAELNRVYGELRDALKDRPEVWEDLRQRQRDWIEYRDYIAEHPASVGGGLDANKESSIGYWEMMAGLTESQAEFLGIFTGDAVPPGRDGVYIDARGGRLTIENADREGFDFTLGVVRGPTFHLGDLEGGARYGADGVALFVDSDEDAFVDGKPCTIRFEFSGKRITLSGENTMFYHGARAYFDGEYFKLSDLPEAATKDLQAARPGAAGGDDLVGEPAASHGWMKTVAALNRRARETDWAVMFVGDSLTQFWEAQGAPVWLLDFAALNSGNFGVAADRVENILWRLEHGLLAGETDAPACFVLMMGTNNLAGQPADSPQRVAGGVGAVLELIARQRAESEVLLLSILPSGYLPDAAELRTRIKQSNQLLEELCRDRERVRFVDVYASFVGSLGHWSEGLTIDGTHLTRRGYDVLAAALRPELAVALAKNPSAGP